MSIRAILSSIFLFSYAVRGQLTIPSVLKSLNEESIPYISVEEFAKLENTVVLDARSKEEYDVSRIEKAIWIGDKNIDLTSIGASIPNKDSSIVVYCSIGVRSEDAAEILKTEGYSNIQNLYGGIFEWKNKGFPVYDANNQPTENVHPFSKYWGKLLTNARKVYSTKE
ncbi:rhodanese-like domain-containing protein [Muricauda sp. 2012CJ35-5]|uniref:Rhodanese-like domain-containing protein n=1 Tax=Flagellimonas spongiicola TaxID=2942208 RepID=A0ABT0PRE7_9FLAO|nr:rhodanese-like domain-containing protein [Allomuricauda spongiicola]MCL6273856.1 rhodanese-like domain-containing protein [Allomuricauda spongiicola]